MLSGGVFVSVIDMYVHVGINWKEGRGGIEGETEGLLI